MVENRLSGTISGSFDKHKPEIDRTIEDFQDLGVTINAPDKGWLYKPPLRQYHKGDFSTFRPLPTEIDMTIKEIEDRFLHAIDKSDFLFIVNPEGFIGLTVTFEIGYATAKGVPIYSKRVILADPEHDFVFRGIIAGIKAPPLEKIVKELQGRKEK